MKNLNLLPTDNKPSRLYFNVNDKEFQICEIEKPSTILKPNRHIYITSDEEIKEGDYVLDDEQDVFQVLEINHKQGILRSDGFTYVIDVCKKIILTTDELYIHNDLIPKEYNTFPQYIQKIDDEFLEWFVKNPSCDEVEILFACRGLNGHTPIGEYKIIIPKEEPKQETTLEERKWLEIFKEYTKYKKSNLFVFFDWLETNYNPPTKK